MEGLIDHFDFTLAELLGKTIAELGQMPANEYAAWRARSVYLKAMKDLKRA
jgi:hypothetical protein